MATSTRPRNKRKSKWISSFFQNSFSMTFKVSSAWMTSSTNPHEPSLVDFPSRQWIASTSVFPANKGSKTFSHWASSGWPFSPGVDLDGVVLWYSRRHFSTDNDRKILTPVTMWRSAESFSSEASKMRLASPRTVGHSSACLRPRSDWEQSREQKQACQKKIKRQNY